MESTLRLDRSLLLFGLLFLGAAVGAIAGGGWKKPKVPALFLFGDSIVDVGNNNYIKGYPLLPVSNVKPYGETYFHKPTGRFCNGRLIFDFIAEYLNLPLQPAFLAPNPDPFRFVKGVNFASAGSGVLDSTYLYEGVINLGDQVQNYLKALKEIEQAVGKKKAAKIVSKSIFVIISFNNDVAEYSANTTLQAQYTVAQFIGLLVTKLATEIQTLLETGARKIVVGGMGPIGCVPRAAAFLGSGIECLAALNTISRAVDAGLLEYVDGINAKLKSTNVILTTNYPAVYQIEENGTSQGFLHGLDACCGGGLDNAVVACGFGNYTVCKKVDQYAFWDFTHLTERAYHIIADLIYYDTSGTQVYPKGIKQLAEA